VKPAELEDNREVAYFLADEVMRDVYQFLMPDHGGLVTSEALALKGADKTQLKETSFCHRKRTNLTKFIFSALVTDPSIAWTELAVNSADYLLHGRTQWGWYQANAEGKHAITSAGEDGRRLHGDVLEHVRVAADFYSQAVVAAIEEKKKDIGKKARCDR
jgi:hypothetical protein